MDPDGTIYFILNFIISFVVCLYIAAQSKQQDDNQSVTIGVSRNIISGFVVFLVNLWFLISVTLPRFDFNLQLMFGALFIFISTVLPFCVGLVQTEKLMFLEKLLFIPIQILNYTITPILTLPVHLIFKIFHLDAQTFITQQDVMDLVEDATEDIIDDEQKEMIENIFLLDDMSAGDIMTHRTDVFAVKSDAICQDVIQQARSEGFSRIPVYENTIDTIIGILYTKDLLNVIDDEAKLNSPVKDICRKAMFVPEACAANELLLQFKLKRTQMAVVVDEYGGTSGIVTMEDVLEEIVGNIQDEYDQEEELFIKHSDSSLTCMAYMDLDEALEQFGITPPEDFEQEDFDTVGGLIIDRLERIPTPEENIEIEYAGINFKVLEVADRRIIRVKAQLI